MRLHFFSLLKPHKTLIIDRFKTTTKIKCLTGQPSKFKEMKNL